MPTATFIQPDCTTQEAAEYKASIDAATRVMSGVAAQFAAHEADPPDMTVVVAAGSLMVAGSRVAQAAQTTGALTAPVTHPRIDRIVIDQITGAVEVVAGAEAETPAAPAVPAGKLPIAQVALATTTTAITNAMIGDERAFVVVPETPTPASLGVVLNGRIDKDAAYTVVAGDKGKVINATTGTWTLSLTAAATLGDGFAFGVLNSGAGTITIDPNASETIDGATTKTVAAGKFVVVYCDGTKFVTIGGFSLADLLAVDGSGSGLDADLLDGYHANNLPYAPATGGAYVPKDVGVSGIGLPSYMSWLGGGGCSSGATTSGAALAYPNGSSPGGSWRNVTAGYVGAGQSGTFQRIS